MFSPIFSWRTFHAFFPENDRAKTENAQIGNLIDDLATLQNHLKPFNDGIIYIKNELQKATSFQSPVLQGNLTTLVKNRKAYLIDFGIQYCRIAHNYGIYKAAASELSEIAQQVYETYMRNASGEEMTKILQPLKQERPHLPKLMAEAINKYVQNLLSRHADVMTLTNQCYRANSQTEWVQLNQDREISYQLFRKKHDDVCKTAGLFKQIADALFAQLTAANAVFESMI